jgi:copper chaperone NosL
VSLRTDRASWTGAVAGLVVLAACSGGPPRPVDIVLNEESCRQCRMAISQREFAGELVLEDGRVETFDDIGCLATWVRETEPPRTAGLFVHDYASGAWLDAREAYFVRSEKLSTPMGSGLAAFEDPSAAREAATRWEGSVLRWDEVLEGGEP